MRRTSLALPTPELFARQVPPTFFLTSCPWGGPAKTAPCPLLELAFMAEVCMVRSAPPLPLPPPPLLKNASVCPISLYYFGTAANCWGKINLLGNKT